MSQLVDCLNRRVYYCARNGMAITLFTLLSDKDQNTIESVLKSAVEDDGQNCTPLVIAARNGHNKVVRLLLNRFKPSVEQEGTVKFDGFTIEGASALWCAAAAGHEKVVKTLIDFGANVNHTAKSNSTPLRAACFDGRLDIVKHLLDCNADISIANKFGNTCLMIASYRGNLDVVIHLLKRGANPNDQALCGATAMHFSAECGHVSIVKELLQHGAVFLKNKNGMTPLIAAAERAKADVVMSLVSDSSCSKLEKIDALELLGASYANDKDNYDLNKAFYYLMSGMKERCADINNKMKKAVLDPIEAYQRHIECQTVAELELIANEPAALHMECLVVRERILGPDNPEIPNPIIFRGAVFADSARFDKCLSLWLHGLNLRHKNKVSVSKDLLRFAQLFSQMLYVGVPLPFRCVEMVLDVAVTELERGKKKLKASSNLEANSISEEHDGNMLTVLYLLVITCKLLKSRENGQPSPVCLSKYTEYQKQHVMQLVYKLNHLNLMNSKKSTLLHLAISDDTYVDEFHTNDVCKFPCSATARLLIECGADVNALDLNRNSPLHIIVRYQRPITDFLSLHAIIMDLIDNGAHLDSVNNDGNTPYEAATTGVTEIILRTQQKICLQCLAARAIHNSNLAYEGQVPYHLEKFIEMHGVLRSSL